MFLSVNFQNYRIRFHASDAANYSIQDIKNTETGVYLGRFSQEYINLITSNDVRDVILDRLYFDVSEDDFAQEAAERVESERKALAQAHSITKFYNHPVWNAGGRTGGD